MKKSLFESTLISKRTKPAILTTKRPKTLHFFSKWGAFLLDLKATFVANYIIDIIYWLATGKITEISWNVSKKSNFILWFSPAPCWDPKPVSDIYVSSKIHFSWTSDKIWMFFLIANTHKIPRITFSLKSNAYIIDYEVDFVTKLIIDIIGVLATRKNIQILSEFHEKWIFE